MKEEYETIDLLEILRLLKKNLLAILAVTILLAVAGYLVSTFAMTPQYEASATLIVNSREDQAAAQAPITNDQLTSATKLVDTYAVILTSDTVLDKTISNLNLNMSYNDLVERVRIESVNSTQVMKITVKDTDPERARAIAADIVEQAPEIIIQTVKAGSVEIISKAKAETVPVSPSKAKNTVLAGMLGLVISVGIVILRYLLNNKFMTDDDIHRYLKIDNSAYKGITSALADGSLAESIINMKGLGLHVMVADAIPPNPVELLGSPRMKNLIDELDKHYEYIIFDTPPVSVVTDAAVLSQYADGVILVVRQNYATFDEVGLAKKNLDAVNANILGAVLNGFDTKSTEKKNGSYYSYNYSYENADR